MTCPTLGPTDGLFRSLALPGSTEIYASQEPMIVERRPARFVARHHPRNIVSVAPTM